MVVVDRYDIASQTRLPRFPFLPPHARTAGQRCAGRVVGPAMLAYARGGLRLQARARACTLLLLPDQRVENSPSVAKRARLCTEARLDAANLIHGRKSKGIATMSTCFVANPRAFCAKKLGREQYDGSALLARGGYDICFIEKIALLLGTHNSLAALLLHPFTTESAITKPSPQTQEAETHS